MKKISKIFIFIFLIPVIFLINNVNVYANDDDQTDNQYSYEDYSYTFGDLILNIYEFRKMNEGNDEEAIENYISETPDDTIIIPEDSYTINPTYKSGKFDKINTVFVDLNLNLEKQTLIDLLEDYIDDLDDETMYLVDIVIEYELQDYPSNYNYLYKYSTFRGIIEAFSGMSNGNSSSNNMEDYEIDFDDLNTQVLNTLSMTKEDNEVKIEYSRTVDENSSIDMYVLNYQLVSPAAIVNDDYSNATAFMFHDIENIDYLIQKLSEDGSNNNSPNNDTELPNSIGNIVPEYTPQVVNVDNTSKNKNYISYLICMILFVLGFSTIFYYLYRKERINN